MEDKEKLENGSSPAGKRRAKKAGIILLISVLLLVLFLAGGTMLVYQFNKSSYGFLQGTTLNGMNIQGLSPSILTSEAGKNLKDSDFILRENGQKVLEGRLSDLGYYFDADAYQDELQRRLDEQKSGFRQVMETMLHGDPIEMEAGYSFDESKLKKYVTADALSVPRVESVDPEVVLDQESNTYVVTDAVQGNMIDEKKLQEYMKEAVLAASKKGQGKGALELEIPAEVYTSHEVVYDAEALKKEAEEKNLELRFSEYKATVITYRFGDESRILDSDTFASWLSMDKKGQVKIDKAMAEEYVAGLADEYNTRRVTREFNTSTGCVVYFSPGKDEYGYTIDQEKEVELLLSELENKQSVSREPIYYETNDYGNPYYYSRNGHDDLNGNYVEVNLTKQHLWFYRDGSLLLETDFVSGNLAGNSGTMTGIFPLAYKESPSTLKGAGYTTVVQYWMPFYEGEGLHDANWRSAFGGQIYRTGGSNGCVNLPPAAAQTIYENITAGMAIAIYYEPGTEPADSTYASDARNAADKVEGVSTGD